MDYQIIPAVLTDDISDVKAKFDLVKDEVDRFSIDIIDGLFANNVTISLDQLEGFDFGEVKMETQLMVEDPTDMLGLCHQIGFTRVYAHVERMHDLHVYIESGLELELDPCFAVDLYTPVEAIDDELLIRTNGILLMSVKAGHSGQSFNEHVLDKIRELRKKGFQGDIQVDGGENLVTIPRTLEAGANHFSVTSGLWDAPDVEKRYDELQQVVKDFHNG